MTASTIAKVVGCTVVVGVFSGSPSAQMKDRRDANGLVVASMESLLPSKMTPVKPGGFVFHPAGGHHYDMAKDEEVIVQIIGMGPVKTPQLEPATRR